MKKNKKRTNVNEETVSQADVLREQFNALKLKQENLVLKKRKLQLQIFLLAKTLDPEERENFSFLEY